MSKIEQARAAWGEGMPDWIETLAQRCDETTQARIARELGASASRVHQVINNNYPGDMEGMEQLVRGALMNETVTCPVIGEIAANACLDWQEKAVLYRNTNPMQIRMFAACRNCSQARRGYS